jgi:hypothetical protein
MRRCQVAGTSEYPVLLKAATHCWESLFPFKLAYTFFRLTILQKSMNEAVSVGYCLYAERIPLVFAKLFLPFTPKKLLSNLQFRLVPEDDSMIDTPKISDAGIP